jgi:hypothetical protein
MFRDSDPRVRRSADDRTKSSRALANEKVAAIRVCVCAVMAASCDAANAMSPLTSCAPPLLVPLSRQGGLKMSELAFNIQGEAFEVPPAATAWRVRRMKKQGAPEVVYGRDGLPLVIPIEAGMDDLKAAVDVSARYRLDPIDDAGKTVKDAVPAYVCVNRDVPDGAAAATGGRPSLGVATDNVVIEALRMNAEMARSVIDRFPMMMEAAAVLLRAADGAGLPARPGMAPEDDDGDAAPALAPTGAESALHTMLAQVVPMLVTGFMSGGAKGKVPSIAELLDWRKAAPRPAAPRAAESMPSTAHAAAEAPSATAGVEPMVPPLDPATMAHFLAVRAALTPEESALAGQIARALSAAELRALLGELAALSIPEAVARVRVLLAGPAKATDGGAS